LTHPTAPQDAVETTDNDGDTALFVVEEVDTARCLIEEFHANAKHENNEGNTPAAAAEENENDELAAYLRSVTGEQPMYQRLSDLQEDEEEGPNGLSSALDDAIDQQTDAMMSRVQDILVRAEQRGAASGQELTEEEEAELRRVVGESVLTQIREGWGHSVGEQQSESVEHAIRIDKDGEEQDEADRIAAPADDNTQDATPPRR
jgi:hypothetical protein